MLSNILLSLEYKLQLLIVSFKPNIDNYSLISNVDNMPLGHSTGASAVVRLPLQAVADYRTRQNLTKLGKRHVRDLEWEAPLTWCDNAAAWVMLLTKLPAHGESEQLIVNIYSALLVVTLGDIHGSAVQGSGVHGGVAQLNPRNCKYNSLSMFR